MQTSSSTRKMINDPLEFIENIELKKNLEEIKLLTQVDQVSLTSLNSPLTLEFYKKWLLDNMHGDMTYLKDHLPLKENPKLIHPTLKSALTFTHHYYPAKHPVENYPKSLRVALYAQNSDYHFWLKDKLKLAITKLQSLYPNEYFIPFVDSGPILERDLAYRSGLGWFGKNTCLIHPKMGSLFFIAEILTSLDINERLPLQHDLCGSCTKCIDICPTQALGKELKMDANKCISYLTIESKQIPAEKLRPLISDWFFGCDLCQTVCPWNQKKLNLSSQLTLNQSEESLHHLKSTKPFLDLNSQELAELTSFLKIILTSSNKKLQKMFYGTALARAGGFGLKKNALIVTANRKIKDLKEDVAQLQNDSKLRDLAKWCLVQLSTT